MRRYLDFDVAIEPAGGEGDYVARVLRSPAGEAEAAFHLPFTAQELEIFILRIGHTRRGTRRSDSPEMRRAREFGRTLFDTVFSGPARTCLIRSLDEAERNSAGLRIRLRLGNDPGLNDLPWEYLYSDDLNRFLIVSTETPIVRYIDLQRRVRPLMVGLPLRILAVVSAPTNLPDLDVEGEWERLQAALQPLVERGSVTLERLERPALEMLQERLRRGDVHVLHFIGHGAFSPGTKEGVLFFTNERGGSHAVSGEDLGTVLHDHRALRLVVLNSCEGARSAPADPFSGSASALVGQGIPAVIAMQFEITDKAALTIAKNFYGALADGYAVDAALAEARKAIFSQGNDVEWGTPVLYMRSDDGRLFDIDYAGAAPAPAPEAAAMSRALLSDASEATRRGEWERAISLLEGLLEEEPGHAEAQAQLENVRRHQSAANLYRGAGFLAAAGQWDKVLERFQAIDALDIGFEDPQDLRAQAVEALEEQRRTEHLTELLGQAETAMDESDWSRAAHYASAVLAEDPGHELARRIVTEAGNRQKVSELYDRARTAADAQQWTLVLTTLGEIDAIGAEFETDPDDLRTRAEDGVARQARQAELDTRYEGAAALIDTEQWDEALQVLDSIAADEPGFRGVEELRSRVLMQIEEAKREAAEAEAERIYVEAIRASALEDWPGVLAALDRIVAIAPAFGDPEGLRDQATAATMTAGDLARTEEPPAAASQADASLREAEPAPTAATIAKPASEARKVGIEPSEQSTGPPPLPGASGWRRLPAWLPGAMILLSAHLPWHLWIAVRTDLLPALIVGPFRDFGGLTLRTLLLVLGALVLIAPYRYPGIPLIRRVAGGLTVAAVLAFALSVGLSDSFDLSELAGSFGPWVALIAGATVVGPRLPRIFGTSPGDGDSLRPAPGGAWTSVVGAIALVVAAWLTWFSVPGLSWNAFDVGLFAVEPFRSDGPTLGVSLVLAGGAALVAVLVARAKRLVIPTWLALLGVGALILAIAFQTVWIFDIEFVERGLFVSPGPWLAALGGGVLAVGYRLRLRATAAIALLHVVGFLVWSSSGSVAENFWSDAASDDEWWVVGLVGLVAALLVQAAFVGAKYLIPRAADGAWTRRIAVAAAVAVVAFIAFAFGESQIGREGGYWASILGSVVTLTAIAWLAISSAQVDIDSPDESEPDQSKPVSKS